VGSPGFNCKEVLISTKLLEFQEHRVPKTPVFTNIIDSEFDIDIDRYKQIATQSLAYISTEMNEKEKNIEGLFLLLKNLKFFKKHKAKIVKELIKVASYEKYPPGTVILREGEPGVHVFVIISGAVIVTKETSGENVVIASAYDGDVIGEYAFIRKFKEFGPVNRAATCTTTEESHLIRIENSDMTDIIERHSDANNDFMQFIRSLQAFENITPVDLALLCNTMTTKQYEMDACILKAGEIPECLFFVYRGRVKIKYPAKQMSYSKVLKTVKHSTITKELTFGSGNYFGQRTLIGKKTPANYPIYADNISFTTLLFIYREDFEQLFKPIQVQILQNLSKSPEFDLKVPEAYSYL
jgi:CRP-like cAMP-binding protein